MKGAAFAVSWSRVWLDMAWDNSYVFLGKWPGNAWNYCNGFRFNGKIFIICGFTRRTDPRSECLGFLQQHSIPKRRLRGTTRRESFQHLAISLAASRVVFLGAWVKAWEIFLGMCACVCVNYVSCKVVTEVTWFVIFHMQNWGCCTNVPSGKLT